VFAPPSPFFKNVKCVRETEIPVEQQPPQGVFVCDHAGRVINKFSLAVLRFVGSRRKTLGLVAARRPPPASWDQRSISVAVSVLRLSHATYVCINLLCTAFQAVHIYYCGNFLHQILHQPQVVPLNPKP